MQHADLARPFAISEEAGDGIDGIEKRWDGLAQEEDHAFRSDEDKGLVMGNSAHPSKRMTEHTETGQTW